MTTRLYVGSYSSSDAAGVHVFTFAPSGAVEPVDALEGVANPSFVTARPELGMVYAVNEIGEPGGVSVIRVGDGSSRVLQTVPSHGGSPCHVSTHDDLAVVANYMSGGIAMYRLRPDGLLGELVGHHVPEGSGPHPRQESSHIHCVLPSPDGRTLHVTDLGTDRILHYAIERNGDDIALTPAGATSLSPGSGPRHIVHHPTEPVLFAVCELDSTLVVLDVDTDSGELRRRATASTLPPEADLDNLAAAVRVDPGGRRVHVSNRGHDSIATFAFDPDGRTVELIALTPSGGHTPRDIAIDPSGRWMVVANQDSDVVGLHEIDGDGIPREIGPLVHVPRPTCVAFAEEGR